MGKPLNFLLKLNNIDLFNSLNAEKCINTFNVDLEKKIESIIRVNHKKYKRKKLETQQILNKTIIYLSTNQSAIDLIINCKVSEDELFCLIKKYFLKYNLINC